MADIVQGDNPFMGLIQDMMLTPAQRFARLVNPTAPAMNMSTPQPGMAVAPPVAPAPAPAAPGMDYGAVLRNVMQQAQNYQAPTNATLSEDAQRSARLRFAAGLMQPRQVGGTYAGIVGNALMGADESLARSRQVEESRMLQRMLLPAKVAEAGANVEQSTAAAGASRAATKETETLLPGKEKTQTTNLSRLNKEIERLDKEIMKANNELSTNYTPEALQKRRDLENKRMAAQAAHDNAAAGEAKARGELAGAQAKDPGKFHPPAASTQKTQADLEQFRAVWKRGHPGGSDQEMALAEEAFMMKTDPVEAAIAAAMGGRTGAPGTPGGPTPAKVPPKTDWEVIRQQSQPDYP